MCKLQNFKSVEKYDQQKYNKKQRKINLIISRLLPVRRNKNKKVGNFKIISDRKLTVGPSLLSNILHTMLLLLCHPYRNNWQQLSTIISILAATYK